MELILIAPQNPLANEHEGIGAKSDGIFLAADSSKRAQLRCDFRRNDRLQFCDSVNFFFGLRFSAFRPLHAFASYEV